MRGRQQNIALPDREPDVILPEEGNTCEVRVWIKENAYKVISDYSDLPDDVGVSTIYSSENEFINPIDYLNYVTRCQNIKRASTALDYLAEMELLRELEII